MPGGLKRGALPLPRRATERKAVDEDDGLPGALILIVELDVRGVLAADGDGAHFMTSLICLACGGWRCGDCGNTSVAPLVPRRADIATNGLDAALRHGSLVALLILDVGVGAEPLHDRASRISLR